MSDNPQTSLGHAQTPKGSPQPFIEVEWMFDTDAQRAELARQLQDEFPGVAITVSPGTACKLVTFNLVPDLLDRPTAELDRVLERLVAVFQRVLGRVEPPTKENHPT